MAEGKLIQDLLELDLRGLPIANIQDHVFLSIAISLRRIADNAGEEHIAKLLAAWASDDADAAFLRGVARGRFEANADAVLVGGAPG